MRVVMYLVTTGNGFIAKEDDDVTFVSKHQWENLRSVINSVGVVVIGRRTYEILHDHKEAEKISKSVRIFVMTRKAGMKSDNPNVTFTNETPHAVLRNIEAMGFDEVLIAGGGRINSLFMSLDLVDEIYLNLEPTFIGRGTRMFADAKFEKKLDIMEVKKLAHNEIQIHYRIIHERGMRRIF
ncbi:MAG: dihydrofolate reductase family protein [Candidatus Micrarchaeota archaeon]|nr:dihydrofolate reductase family protein [Candidatus Micrarchaeota archaeon]